MYACVLLQRVVCGTRLYDVKIYLSIYCTIDLEYGLPVQVRDQALSVKDNTPKSDVGKEYFLQNLENQVGILIDIVRVHRNELHTMELLYMYMYMYVIVLVL